MEALSDNGSRGAVVGRARRLSAGVVIAATRREEDCGRCGEGGRGDGKRGRGKKRRYGEDPPQDAPDNQGQQHSYALGLDERRAVPQAERHTAARAVAAAKRAHVKGRSEDAPQLVDLEAKLGLNVARSREPQALSLVDGLNFD